MMASDFTPGNREPGRYRKTKLSAALVGVIAAAMLVITPTSDEDAKDEATLQILEQFIGEREGSRTTAYRDGGSTTDKRIWTICKGLTKIDGEPVTQGMRLTADECRKHDRKELRATLNELRRIVRPDVWATLSPVNRAGITSFCTYNIGSGKCRQSTFLLHLNAGRRNEACAQITLWIRDQGKDCRIRASQCFGQVDRRQMEDEMCLAGVAQ
jgi:lysozyme